MRSKEAIAQADELRPNALGEKQKLDWLLELEAEVSEMMSLSEPPPTAEGEESGRVWDPPHKEAGESSKRLGVSGIRAGLPLRVCDIRNGGKAADGCPIEPAPTEAGEWREEPPLLLPPPKDRVYVLYLAAMIDFYNGEMGLYANDYALYNQEMAAVRAWWRRHHRPRPKKNWRT